MIGHVVTSKPILRFGFDILLSFYIDGIALSILKGLIFATAYSVLPYSIYNKEHFKDVLSDPFVSNQIKFKACPDRMQHKENQGLLIAGRLQK